ncbi:uncharacterized protein LOC110458542 isoform X7 [Mizuhopecten yessoensis]|uniref:uncharacterized protein LOC110458542 isoform X7 n=1 Tax=Mizuhopecten yessoensis TaxID=6573 RepID=UPI000B45F80D|nr:uncharacterized protein LOC110458542 isoform X7 [Mizuhopecten yessoensis]
MVIEKEYKISKDLIWLADGYKHKLHISDEDKDIVLPCDSDNFNLHPVEQTNSYAGIRVSTPENLTQNQRRVQSATYIRLQQKSQRPGTAPPSRSGRTCWTGNESNSSSRPGSGRPPSAASVGSKPPSGQRRAGSAGSVAARARALAKMRQGFTLVNKLYENGHQSKNITLHPASPAPDYRYFDRHSRCLDHTHMHDSLLRERPQTACEPSRYCHGIRRPMSAASSGYHDPDVMDQPQRYINFHRPKTAPSTRNELKNLPRSHYIFRGRQPKFCNIVQQVQLHARDLRSPTPTRQMDEDYNDFDYIRKTIDGDMLRRRRKYSDTTRPKTASPRGHLSVPTSDSRRNDKHILSKNHRRNVSPKRKLSSWCKRRCGGTEEHSFDDVDLRKVEPPVEEEEVIAEKAEPETGVKTSGTEGRPTSPSSQDGDTKIDVTIMGLEKAPSPPLRGNWSPTVTDINPKSQPESEDLTSLLDNPVSATDTKKSDTPTLFLHNDTELDGTGGPPAQPPPTPEILTPKEPVEEKPATKRPRTCTKKTKVPITKTRKPKEEMEKKEDETAKVETPLPAPPPEESKEEKDIKVNIAVPELPTYQKDENQRKTKEKRKSERHLVVKPKFEPKDDPVDQLDEDLKARIREFDWSTMEMTGSEESPRKQQKAAWVTGRLALSQQSSRFELPMDMRVLESMTTQEYIREYCKITKRRQKLYSDVFRKNAKQKERNVYVIPFKDLRKALMDVLVNTLTDDHYSMLVEHMAFAQDAEIDLVLFSALSALAERLMYPQFVTQETVDMPDYMKEKIECADFGALRWKMQGVNVSPGIKKLLLQLS